MQREQKIGQDMERLLLALQGRLGEEFHVKSDRDGEKTVFCGKKERGRGRHFTVSGIAPGQTLSEKQGRMGDGCITGADV